MSDTLPNLLFLHLAAARRKKHVTVNETTQRLDALVQLAVVSVTASVQPGSPADGTVYILPTGKTGADWGGMSNYSLAYHRDGSWEQITPREGWLAYVKDTDQLLYYAGSAWALFLAGKLLTLSASDTACLIRAGRGGGGDVHRPGAQLCDDASFSSDVRHLGHMAGACGVRGRCVAYRQRRRGHARRGHNSCGRHGR